MEYLGYTVLGDNYKVCGPTKKIEAVKDWPAPTTQKEDRSFLHFRDFYAKSIHHFDDLTAPFIDYESPNHR
jgi:hypothetical protein